MTPLAQTPDHVLVVVDVQNDFVSGALAAPGADQAVSAIVERLRTETGHVVFTLDTHDARYLDSDEGRSLPVLHGQKPSWGWQLDARVAPFAHGHDTIEKDTFGALALAAWLRARDREHPVTRVTLVGLVTDICVLANAVIAKAALPNATVSVVTSATAGTSETNKARALETLKGLFVTIEP